MFHFPCTDPERLYFDTGNPKEILRVRKYANFGNNPPGGKIEVEEKLMEAGLKPGDYVAVIKVDRVWPERNRKTGHAQANSILACYFSQLSIQRFVNREPTTVNRERSSYPLIIRGIIIWCWGQIDMGFW